MSYSSLVAVYKTKATELKEYSNSWGSAPVIWDYLAEKYLPVKPEPLNYQPIWDLSSSDSVPAELRAVLMFTFDGAYCPPEYAKDLSEACQYFYDLTKEIYKGRVNHWQEIADDLKKFKLNKRAKGFGLDCTSVQHYWVYQKLDNEKLWSIFK